MYEALDILRPDLDGFNSLAWPLDLSGWGSDALNMSPHTPVDDIPDRLSINAILPRQLALTDTGSTLLANGDHLIRGKARISVQLAAPHLFGVLSQIMSIAARKSLGAFARWTVVTAQCALWIALHAISAFSGHIAHIIGLCTDKQVVRSHAVWIIAMVAYIKTRRNWPEVDLPRNAMREVIAPTNGKTTIAGRDVSTDPIPASVRICVNFLPKSFDNLFGKWTERGLSGNIGHVGNSFQVIGHATGGCSRAVAF